jgi:SGT1 protein
MEAGSLLQEALLRQADRQQLSDSDQDVLWLDIHLLPPASTTASCKKDELICKLLELAKLCKDANAFFQSLADSFDWHVGGDGPVFGIHASDRIPHLRAICRYGANVADEWTSVELMRQYTISHPGLAVECWDGQDGQILLIESANVLPIWVDSIGPDAMRHRCWIRSGQVQLIAPEENFQAGQISCAMGLQEALQILQEGGPRVEAPVRMQQAIRDCVSQLVSDRIVSDRTDAHSEISTSQRQNQHRHKAVIALPRPVAHLVRERPDLVNAAILAFANHALQPDRKLSRNSPKIECEDWVMTCHSFSRTNYAMLRTLVSAHTWKSETTVPNAYQSVELRRMQRQCAVDATPHLRHAVHIGVRLVAGFDELIQSKEHQPSTSLVERRVLQYWPRFLEGGLSLASDSVRWLYDAWKMGPNHAAHDISDILDCPVVQEEFTSDNITPLSHPEESLTAQIRKEIAKDHNATFIVPRQDEVDPNEDWMVVTDEAMEKQLKSRNSDVDADTTTTQPRPAEEQEQVAQLATMLNSFQTFMVDKSGPEGVCHNDASGNSKVPPAETFPRLNQTNTPIQINPRVFLNLLQSVLDKSTTSESISLPPPLATIQNGAADEDAFFSRADYEAMEPTNEHDDNYDYGALDTDVVELMVRL